MNVIVVEYEKYQTVIREIRETVFVIEQNVPHEIEFDQSDDGCMYAIVLDDETPIAVGRINLSKQGNIGRIAVLKEYRRIGIGNLLMQTLEQYAKAHEQNSLWLNAQKRAIPFYSQLGYEVVGDEFLEGYIIHMKMEKVL